MPIGLGMDAETIRKYSTWFMVYGIALILLGAIAIIAPGFATLAASVLLGWLLLIGGVFGVIAAFSAGTSAPGSWWHLLTAALYLLAGIALLWAPVAGALTLTIILAAYLLAAGVAKVVLAFRYRPSLPGTWAWMLVTGLIDIALGLLIASGLPGSALWVLGLMIGIDLLFSGVALVAAAIHFRRLARAETASHGA